MRWTLLGIAACAFASLCRARLRVADHLRRLHPNTDMAQRLATAPITPTVADRHLGFGPMTVLNLATGVAGSALLIWGIVLRVF